MSPWRGRKLQCKQALDAKKLFFDNDLALKITAAGQGVDCLLGRWRTNRNRAGIHHDQCPILQLEPVCWGCPADVLLHACERQASCCHLRGSPRSPGAHSSSPGKCSKHRTSWNVMVVQRTDCESNRNHFVLSFCLLRARDFKNFQTTMLQH